MLLVDVNNVYKIFERGGRDFTALNDVNFSVNSGDFINIVGKSGSGDSDIMMTDTINPLKSKFKASTKLLNKTI